MTQEARPTGLTYEPFYGLREKPFSLTSDSRFFYQSRSHAPAFDDLLNAIRRRESLNVLTGDIGTGKTTLCRAVLESLDRKTFSAFVPDPFASREDLLKVLLADFGVASIDDVTSGRLREATRTELSYLLYEFLGTLAPLQAFAVVFIDEAQNLSQQLLEEVRILSDADGQLQVVLVGQLELREQLTRADMRQLDQRVSVHCRLQPLDLAGVSGYISHRLHVAGGSSDRVRFTGEAVEAIYQMSGGVPRIINRLCDRALRYGYSKREAAIDAEIVQRANPELSGTDVPAAAAAAPVPVPIAAPPPIVPAPAVAAPLPVIAVAAPVEAQVDTRIEPPVAPVDRVPEPHPPEPDPPRDAAVAPAPDLAFMTHQDALESWLAEIDRQPGPPVDLDWRQRWHATNAVATPLADRRSGVRVRIPAAANAQAFTRVDRVRRRWTVRLFWTAVASILLLAALVAGPASVAASLDIWSQIDEQFTAPSPPLPPHALRPSPRLQPLPVPPLDLEP